MRRHVAVLVASLMSVGRGVTAGEAVPVAPQSLVRVHAPKAFDVPGVLTAAEGRTDWRVQKAKEDLPFFSTEVEGWTLQVAAPRPGGTLEGRVVSVDTGELVVTLPGRSGLFRIPPEAIARLDVSRGRASRARNVLLGGATGLGSGLALTAGIAALCVGWDCIAAIATLFVLTPILTVAGLVAGAVVGPGERWQEVRRERLRVSFAPSGKAGVAFRASLAF